LFCFALTLALAFIGRRVSSSLAAQTINSLSFVAAPAVNYLAFVAAPPLFIALILTKRPDLGLRFALPAWWSWPCALILAVLLFLPGAELTWYTLQQFPGLRDALRENLGAVSAGPTPYGLSLQTVALCLTLLAFLQALSEEILFRGFILSGLSRRFRPWTACLLSGFLFALFQMNVFQAVPHFLLGVLMGFLVQRTGSLWPAVLFHFAYNALVYNVLILAPSYWPDLFAAVLDGQGTLNPFMVVLGFACTLIAGSMLFLISRRAAAAAAGQAPRTLRPISQSAAKETLEAAQAP
jgi:sodium transport system permease protein